MPFATRLTKVRDRSEHFDERTGMCYHQAPPTERVVVHVRDAAQAKPHLEQNPLSLLGACYATLSGKLNGPGCCRACIAPATPGQYNALQRRGKRNAWGTLCRSSSSRHEETGPCLQ